MIMWNIIANINHGIEDNNIEIDIEKYVFNKVLY